MAKKPRIILQNNIQHISFTAAGIISEQPPVFVAGWWNAPVKSMGYFPFLGGNGTTIETWDLYSSYSVPKVETKSFSSKNIPINT